DAMAQSSDKIITISCAMQQDRVRHDWAPSKISTVWNGVDPERYDMAKCMPKDIAATREKYSVHKDWNMLLFVGRLSWVKGARNLLLAMLSVLKEFPNTKLIILGKVEEQRDIVESADRLNIKNNVAFRFDFVLEPERIMHYAASDVCIFPSFYEPWHS